MTRSIGLLAALACLVFLAFALRDAAHPGARAEGGESPAGLADAHLIEQGSTLYRGMCGTCHGGRGDHEALGLSRRIAELPAAEIVEALTRYRDTGDFTALPIPIKSALSDADIRALATYIAGFAEPGPQ